MENVKTRSRSLRRVYKRLPGGRLTVHFEKRKPQKAKCASCSRPLSGVARGIASRIRKLAKTERKPERPYGGYLCAPCTRERIIERVRRL